MADESQETDSSAAGGSAALSMAFGMAAQNERVAAKVEAFVEQQTRVLRLQQEQMEEEAGIHRWSLRIRHFSDVMKVAFELSLAFIFVAIAVGIGATIWTAAHDKGLVIESFSVPPDMAARGLSGEVVAAKLLDRLSSLQAQTASLRAATSYSNNWGNDIKVQIPDTGVSIGEFYRYLRNWLGHETRISGEVYRTATGIAVTARAGSEASPTFTGPDSDLDKLLQQAAEAVYRNTQPYRYAVYLQAHNREAEANAVFNELITTGSPEDRAWAYIGLSTAQNIDPAIANDDLRRAIAIEPALLLSYEDLANNDGAAQHDEQQILDQKKAVEVGERGGDTSMDPAELPARILQDKASLAGDEGDFVAVLALDRQILDQPEVLSRENTLTNDFVTCGAMHDADCTDRLWSEMPRTSEPNVELNRYISLQLSETFLNRFHAAAAMAPRALALLKALGKPADIFTVSVENPYLALDKASLGDFASAHRLIDTSPLDCATCMRIRGRIDALQKNWNGAEYWFERAARETPSVAFAFSDWGAMLLAKGDADAAIARLSRAHDLGPHFADPIEMWGEALMLENRSDLALAKFAEADKYTPHWGRLHLKWAEALYYTGRKDEAKKQFEDASHYELTSDERKELARARRLN